MQIIQCEEKSKQIAFDTEVKYTCSRQNKVKSDKDRIQ